MLAPTTAGAGQQKPQPVETIYIYEDEVVSDQPKTLLERVTEVDAAIRCRVHRVAVRVGKKPDLPPSVDPKYGLDVFTEHLVAILEVFKSDAKLPELGSGLTVVQAVGDAVVGNLRIRRMDESFRQFAPGEEYVLLLKWDDIRQRFGVIASDTFLISGGKIASPGHASYARQSTGTMSSDFLSRLRWEVWPRVF